MGPSKKRKEPSPNCTLLDFFSHPDATKRTKTRPSRQSAHTVSRAVTKVASRDIIVIDSDSDDGVLDPKEKTGRSPRLDPKAGVSEDSLLLSSVASTFTASEDKVTFGAPSALLPPPIPRVETLDGFKRLLPIPDGAESMFGVSAPLLEPRCNNNQLLERNQTHSVALENTSSAVEGNSADNTLAEFPIGEWAAGDDEHVDLEGLDNIAEADEGEEEPFDEQHFCPVCRMDLTGTLVSETQTHVNQCLDIAKSQSDGHLTGNVTRRHSLFALPIRPDQTLGDSGANAMVKGQGSNLFAVLMNSHKDNEIWVEMDAATNREFGPTRGNRRKAPFYKVLQGMPIAVDAFCYGTIPGVTSYFLTHAHSDHYTNLGSKWKSGPIYCSEETANLIMHMLAVDPMWIHPLPMDTPTMIPNTGGGQQTVEAGDNAFKSPFIGSSKIFRYLHCGDFRASPRHVLHPAVNGRYIDYIYLDTTYLDPKYTFSPQPLVISACAELARRLVMAGVADDSSNYINRNLTIDSWMKPSSSTENGGEQHSQKRILVIVGTYSIGKERIVKAIAQALGAKIYCDSRKTAILRCQADKELHTLLTSDPIEANVHLLPLGTVTSDNLKLYLQRFRGTFSRVIGFRPTGWTYSPPSSADLGGGSIRSIISRGQSRHFSHADLQPSPKSSYNIQIFGVPYSEHSSFFELTCFAMSCDWGKMIPTVNVGSRTARAKMTKWLKRWESEKKSTKPSVIPPRTDDYW